VNTTTRSALLGYFFGVGTCAIAWLLITIAVDEGPRPLPSRANSVSGKLYSNFRPRLFRLCQTIRDDQDAANMFLWSNKEWSEQLGDERILRKSLTEPLVSRKDVVTCFGILELTTDDVKFSIEPAAALTQHR